MDLNNFPICKVIEQWLSEQIGELSSSSIIYKRASLVKGSYSGARARATRCDGTRSGVGLGTPL